MSNRLSTWIDNHARLVLLAFAVVTALFAVANVALDDDVEASQEPSAAVFDARETLNDRLPSVTHSQFVLVEATGGGDVFRAQPLAELVANGRALRSADKEGLLTPDGLESSPLLADRFDRDAGVRIDGFLSLAEVVAGGVRDNFGVSLEEATDEMVKVVLANILANPQTAGLAGQISDQATRRADVVLGQPITVVEAPALVFEVQAWNEPLGGGQFAIGPSADPVVLQKEDFNLKVEEYLRGDQEYIEVLTVAAAANATSEQQGQAAAPFIVFAAVAAVLIVGLALRSYWATALTGAGLAVLMTWLGGISNLFGLKGGLVIDLLVPISMIALGVDFAVHSMAHYSDERRREEQGESARNAFRLGFGGVLGALVLAAVTDSAAFLSNTSSDIESIAHFGIAAAIGTVSSFVVLGVIAPLVLSRIEDSLEGPHRIGRFARSELVATLRVAGMAGAASIVTLAISPLVGAVFTVVVIVVNIVVPFRFARRHYEPAHAAEASAFSSNEVGPVATAIGSTVANLASRPIAVLLAVSVLTGVSLFGALGLQGSFAVADFFSSDTDFVQSVDKLPAHFGSRAGEPNQILVEGELTDPEVWVDLGGFVTSLDDNTALAVNTDGGVQVNDPQPLEVLARLTGQPDVIEAATGVRPSDANGDGIPDTAEQLRAVWAFAIDEGVSRADGSSLFSAAEIRSIIDFGDSGADAVLFQVEIPDPSDFDNLKLAKAELEVDTTALETSSFVESATATGSGLGRLEVIDASTDALKTSLPIAIGVVFLVLLIGLRSLRYAVVTTIPMMLVATWLYGTMALFGFDLNFVTATIGAISIGIGADYAIHMTKRYRTERLGADSHIEAARAAAESTGVALLASAGSTAIGFAILAFAPMPLFATFGLLTALMVVFALLASLLVLPSLLVLVDRSDARSASAESNDQVPLEGEPASV